MVLPEVRTTELTLAIPKIAPADFEGTEIRDFLGAA